MSSLLNNNLRDKPLEKKNKILIITYDNRTNTKYIQLHNDNLNEYAKKWNIEYKYFNKCNKNNYWCKIYIIYDLILTKKYDYIMWMDSDTYIKNMDIDLNKILNQYDSDIFIGSDNNPKYDITNAGVFIIKNSIIGVNFLEDCINYVNKSCFKKDGTLKGNWAGMCYEQGVMNILIADEYNKYTTLLSNNIIFNYNKCSNDVFIMHMYASSDKSRTKCFKSSEKKIEPYLLHA
jgi:hypothetical protein